MAGRLDDRPEVGVKSWALSACVVIAGCSAGSAPQTSEAVAAITRGETLTIAFTDPDHLDRLPDLLAGESPTSFIWTRVTLPGDALLDQDIDLSIAVPHLTLSNSFHELCELGNPGAGSCTYIQSFQAGDAGVSGDLIVDIDGDIATLQLDSTWSGITTEFGGTPVDYHLETVSFLRAPISGSGP